MFDTVVIGLDGSPESKRALPVALDLARRDGGRIVAVHVREMLVGRAGGQPLNVNEDEVEAEVRRQIAEISSTGVEIGLTVVSAVAGGPAHVLATSRARNTPMFVIGTRGHSQITGLLVGSATHRLLHIAPCAVYVVPPVDKECVSSLWSIRLRCRPGKECFRKAICWPYRARLGRDNRPQQLRRRIRLPRHRGRVRPGTSRDRLPSAVRRLGALGGFVMLDVVQVVDDNVGLAAWSASTVPSRSTAMTSLNPAERAACIPSGVVSKSAASEGSAPSSRQAAMSVSGAGLGASCSESITSASMR